MSSILSPIMKRKGRRPAARSLLFILPLLLLPRAAVAAAASFAAPAGRRASSALASIGSSSSRQPQGRSLTLPSLLGGGSPRKGPQQHQQQQRGRRESLLPAATAAGAAAGGVVGIVGQVAEEAVQGLALFAQVLSAKKDHLVAGAVARGVMISSLYPVDTVKTRVQMFGAAEGLKKLNLQSLYAGMASSLLGQMPYGMLVYGSYEVYKDMLLGGLPKLGKDAASLLAAVASDVTGSVWLCPSEVIKQQMQSAAIGAKSSLRGAVQQCWREGKGIGGFYQGYGGLLLRDIPFRALQLPLYERTKSWLDRCMEPDSVLAQRLPGNDLDAWKEGIAGAFSGTLAAWVTTPFDVLKTRLQVDASYKGPWDCAVKVFRKEGPRGLFSGAVPRTVYIGPSTALFFVAYGAVRSYIHASPKLASSWEHPEQFEDNIPAEAAPLPSTAVTTTTPFNKRPSRGERANFIVRFSRRRQQTHQRDEEQGKAEQDKGMKGGSVVGFVGGFVGGRKRPTRGEEERGGEEC